MRNSIEKKRDMIRSVLPSKRRHTARKDKRHINRVHRRNEKLAVRSYNPDPIFDEDGEFVDDDRAETALAGIDAHYREFINYAKWDRRDADKLGPILSWAEAKLETIPEENRNGWLNRNLGDTPMGRHAITHIRWLDVVPDDNPYHRWENTVGGRQHGLLLRGASWARMIPMMKYVVRNDLQHELARRANSKYRDFLDSPECGAYNKFLCPDEESIEAFINCSVGPPWGFEVIALVGALGEILDEQGVAY